VPEDTCCKRGPQKKVSKRFTWNSTQREEKRRRGQKDRNPCNSERRCWILRGYVQRGKKGGATKGNEKKRANPNPRSKRKQPESAQSRFLPFIQKLPSKRGKARNRPIDGRKQKREVRGGVYSPISPRRLGLGVGGGSFPIRKKANRGDQTKDRRG